MSTLFHRRLLMALLVSLAFAAFPTFSYATHSWGGYHWARTTSSFTLQLGNNLSGTWPQYLSNAKDGGNDSSSLKLSRTGWNFSNVLDLSIVGGNAGSNLRKCPPTNGRVEVCNYNYGTNGWLGVAQIWLTGGHIYQGTVKLNDSYFNNSRYPKYNSAPWRNLVICQEVGHTFGLDHQDESFSLPNLGTCMDYTSDPTALSDILPRQDNEFPNDHDYQELADIYKHTNDGTTTVLNSPSAPSGPGKGKMPPALTDPDSDEPVRLGTAQWGKLVHSTNNGRTERFELDLGGGHKVVTHVIWADPEEEPGPQRGRR